MRLTYAVMVRGKNTTTFIPLAKGKSPRKRYWELHQHTKAQRVPCRLVNVSTGAIIESGYGKDI